MAVYTPQVWTDTVTPVDSSHMTHIEQGIGAAVPADNVAAAAARVVQNMLEDFRGEHKIEALILIGKTKLTPINP